MRLFQIARIINWLVLKRLLSRFGKPRALALRCQSLAVTPTVPSAILAKARLGYWDFSLRPWRPLIGRVTRNAMDSFREAVPRACVVARGVFAITATARTINFINAPAFLFIVSFTVSIKFFGG